MCVKGKVYTVKVKVGFLRVAFGKLRSLFIFYINYPPNVVERRNKRPARYVLGLKSFFDS